MNNYQTHRSAVSGALSEDAKTLVALQKMVDYINSLGRRPEQGENSLPEATDPLWIPFKNILRVNGTAEGLLKLDDGAVIVGKPGVVTEENPAEGGGVLLG